MMIDHDAFALSRGFPESEQGPIDYPRHLIAARRLRSEAAHAWSGETRKLLGLLAKGLGGAFRVRRHPIVVLRSNCGCAETA